MWYTCYDVMVADGLWRTMLWRTCILESHILLGIVACEFCALIGMCLLFIAAKSFLHYIINSLNNFNGCVSKFIISKYIGLISLHPIQVTEKQNQGIVWRCWAQVLALFSLDRSDLATQILTPIKIICCFMHTLCQLALS